MSGISPERMAEISGLLQELTVLRRREAVLLERLYAILSANPPPAAPVAPPAIPSDWLDAAVDAALSKAFAPGTTADEEGDADDGAEAPGRAITSAASLDSTALPVAATDPDLLLLRSGELSAGFPWQKVVAIGLSEEAEPGTVAISMHAILGGENGGSEPDEPYRISWKSTAGSAALTCEFLAGVVSASTAATRGVELVLAPSDTGGDSPCRVLTLLDYLTGDRGPVPEAIEPGRPEVLAAATPAPSAEPVPEPAPASEPRSELDAAPAPDLEPPSPATAVADAVAPDEPVSVPRPVPISPPIPVGQPIPVPQVIPVPQAIPLPQPTAPPPRIGPAEFPRGPALVAVRYLPARVAIARVLRSLGFFAAEAPDNQELPALLNRGSYSVVFAEPPDPVDPAWLEALQRSHGLGTSVVVVTSRLRARARDPLRLLQGAPRLYHPFREGEIERTLGALRATERTR